MKSSIDKFIKAHEQWFDIAYSEIKEGRKRNHYMWFIFPQIYGLGSSETSRYYAIKNKSQLFSFYNNTYLRHNILTLSSTLLNLSSNNPKEIFGEVDSLKLKSSMTLFYLVTGNIIFKQVLDKYYKGEMDELTLALMKKLEF